MDDQRLHRDEFGDHGAPDEPEHPTTEPSAPTATQPGEILPGGPLPGGVSAVPLGGPPVSHRARTDVEVVPGLLAEPPEAEVTHKGTLILRRLVRNKAAVAGIGMLLVAALFALFGNVGNPFTHTDQDLISLGVPPGENGHRVGTNAGGIDLWAMLVRGTGKSLLIAVFVGFLSPVLAAVYGTAIAFWGGFRERAGMWILDLLILMPYFLIIAVIMGSTGGSAVVLALLLTMFQWMPTARVVRAMTQSTREREFVQSARFMGVSDWAIIRRHIIPNISSYLILTTVTGTSGAIILETALSFLGVGVRPPDVSLGQLIGQSSTQLAAYPWLFWGPVACLVWITLALSFVGDGLRDALDPNSRSGGRA